jgi:hypothetical protein
VICRGAISGPLHSAVPHFVPHLESNSTFFHQISDCIIAPHEIHTLLAPKALKNKTSSFPFPRHSLMAELAPSGTENIRGAACGIRVSLRGWN